MTSLTDRYVHATARELPERQREEVSRELRAAIGDQVDARVAAGEPPESAEHAVLTELGDPLRLAAGYTGRPLALIGPAAYPTWRRLLVTLLSIVPPIVGVLAGVGAVVDGKPALSVIGQVLWTGIVVALHLCFWVTLVFALLERAGTFDDRGSAEGDRQGDEWTPDDLPALAETPIGSRGEALSEVLFTALVIAFFPAQAIWLTVGDDLPPLDPDLWSFWIPYLMAVLGLSALLTLRIAARGLTTWRDAAAISVLGAAFAVPVAWLAMSDRLLNPAYVAHFGWLTDNVGTVNTVIAVSVLLVWAYETWEIIMKARRSAATPQPPS